jgi:hypothetical protein
MWRFEIISTQSEIFFSPVTYLTRQFCIIQFGKIVPYLQAMLNIGNPLVTSPCPCVTHEGNSASAPRTNSCTRYNFGVQLK